MYIGIDFGTSFSQAATTHMGEPILLLPGGTYGVPSAFYYDKETGALVGTEAIDEGQGINAVNLKREIKLELGTAFKADGKEFTSEDIVSAMYKYIAEIAKRIAEQKCIDGFESIEGVVISAPANFNMQELSLLKSACMRAEEEGGAGLDVRAIIKEPVAAALAYFRTPGERKNNVLVFDLGGGTCDIALLNADPSIAEHYTVIDSDMVRIGGVKWDEKIMEYILARLESKVDIDIRSNPGYMEKIRSAAVDAKHSLTEVEQKNIRIEIDGTVHKIPLTRKQFDELTADLLDETIALLGEVYKRNNRTVKIQDIICVGGSSLMPQVKTAIKAALPDCNVHIFRPETAVAFGTAIYADMIKDQKQTVTDISAYSYGVRVYDDYQNDPTYEIISNLIVKGQELPAFCVRTFNTVKAGGGEVVIRIYENDIAAKTCEIAEVPQEPIGKLVMFLPSNTPNGYNVHVNMMLNSSRLLEVEAFDDNNNKVRTRLMVEKK